MRGAHVTAFILPNGFGNGFRCVCLVVRPAIYHDIIANVSAMPITAAVQTNGTTAARHLPNVCSIMGNTFPFTKPGFRRRQRRAASKANLLTAMRRQGWEKVRASRLDRRLRLVAQLAYTGGQNEDRQWRGCNRRSISCKAAALAVRALKPPRSKRPSSD